jgi:hypothetical protein
MHAAFETVLWCLRQFVSATSIQLAIGCRRMQACHQLKQDDAHPHEIEGCERFLHDAGLVVTPALLNRSARLSIRQAVSAAANQQVRSAGCGARVPGCGSRMCWHIRVPLAVMPRTDAHARLHPSFYPPTYLHIILPTRPPARTRPHTRGERIHCMRVACMLHAAHKTRIDQSCAGIALSRLRRSLLASDRRVFVRTGIDQDGSRWAGRSSLMPCGAHHAKC